MSAANTALTDRPATIDELVAVYGSLDAVAALEARGALTAGQSRELKARLPSPPRI